MRIKNFDELATGELRRHALEILEAGYAAIDTETLVRSKITLVGEELCINDDTYTCSLYERIFFVGIGKCAVDAAHVFEDLLGERLTDGVTIDVRTGTFKKIRSFAGTHPLPSPANIAGTEALVSMLSGLTERDLVLVLISGGGSALLCMPYDMDCSLLAQTTELLMHKGATIQELNTVRKHLSRIHGGHLAKLCYPATVVSFILSDVPGNDISFIASGPTVKDESTVVDALSVLSTHGLLTGQQSLASQLIETPKEDKYFERVKNILLMTNRDALEAMQKEAESLGYSARILTDTFTGEASTSAAHLLTHVRTGSCVLAGGETTVTVRAHGKGGRNQELVLGALPLLPDNVVLISAASDGWDNSDVAGALGDRALYTHAVDKSLAVDDYLSDNDSYHFFKTVGGHIITGRTGTNVADLLIVLSA